MTTEQERLARIRWCECGQPWIPAAGLYGTTEETQCQACTLRFVMKRRQSDQEAHRAAEHAALDEAGVPPRGDVGTRIRALALTYEQLAAELRNNRERLAEVQLLWQDAQALVIKLRAELSKSHQVAETRRQQLIAQQSSNERRNRALDALHYVWCNGGCASGVHRWTDEQVTEELVVEAERNTHRLRAWFENRKARDGDRS